MTTPFQDHPGFGCVWEYVEALPPRNNLGEATFFWKSQSGIASPDWQTRQGEVPLSSTENAAKFDLPASGWTLFGGVVRPKSRGRIGLTGPNPLDPVQIDANFLSHPDELKAAIACVELCREIGSSAPLRPFTKREVPSRTSISIVSVAALGWAWSDRRHWPLKNSSTKQ